MPSEPTTFSNALSTEEGELWEEACRREIIALLEHQVFGQASKPRTGKVIPTKWLFKRKSDEYNNVSYKAKLVATGFEAENGVDYERTFAPTVRFASIRLLIAFAAVHSVPIFQLDVNSASMIGTLSEDIYVCPAPGYPEMTERGKVWKLNKPLYGLKRTPDQWQRRISTFLRERVQMYNASVDYGVYSRRTKKKFVFLALSLDDILIFGSDGAFVRRTINMLKKEFNLKELGVLTNFMGMTIDQNFQAGYTKVGQAGFVDALAEKFHVVKSISITTPMNPSYNPDILQARDSENEFFDGTLFRSISAPLQHLARCTRPDIAFSVNNLARFSNGPRLHHYNAAMRILQYVTSTADYSLKYVHQESCGFTLSVDAAFNDRNGSSYRGYIGKYAGGPIYWNSEKFPCVSTNRIIAKYYSICYGVDQLKYHDAMNKAHHMAVGSEPYDILCDNKEIVGILTSWAYPEVMKEVATEYGYGISACHSDEYNPNYIDGEENYARMMIKALPTSKLHYFNRLVHLVS